MIAKLTDRAIESSNILTIIKNDIKTQEIIEFNYNLLLEHDDIRSDQEYGTIFKKLEDTDLRQIVTKRLLPRLREIVEAKGFTIVISRNRISQSKYTTEEDLDVKTSTVTHVLAFASDSGSPEIYEKSHHKGEKQKVPLVLYLKILKYNLLHQYDKDIIYQTESQNYFRIKECIICYERLSNVLYLGCMHLQLCDRCQMNKLDPNYDAVSKGRSNCPICKTWTGHKDFDWIIIDCEDLDRKYPICEEYSST